jgi:SAM-dependent methyltransferase
MHFSLLATQFDSAPPDATPFRILDIGSQNVNGDLKSALDSTDLVSVRNVTYIGLDNEPGSNVDVVISPKARHLPFPSDADHFDAIITSSALEHDPRFWVTFLKMIEVLKPGGLLYMSVPQHWQYHKHPIDCWRFMNDSAEALASWGRDNGHSIHTVFALQLSQKAIINTLGTPAADSADVDMIAIFYKALESPASDEPPGDGLERGTSSEDTSSFDGSDEVQKQMELFNNFIPTFELYLNHPWVLASCMKALGSECLENCASFSTPSGVRYYIRGDYEVVVEDPSQSVEVDVVNAT